MLELPSPEKLAQLVSNVTETMLGISFAPSKQTVAERLIWRTVLLPIPGKHPLTIGLSTDKVGCVRLCSAMFQVPSDAVDPEMMDDSLRELANMTAGLLKSTLALDQALGLPRVVLDGGAQGGEGGQLTILQAKDVGLVLWIFQGIV